MFWIYIQSLSLRTLGLGVFLPTTFDRLFYSFFLSNMIAVSNTPHTPLIRWNCLWETIQSFCLVSSTNITITIILASTALHHQAPAEATTLHPAAALQAATTILHHSSLIQMPCTHLCLHPRLITSPPPKNCSTWERHHSFMQGHQPHPAAAGAQQRLWLTHPWSHRVWTRQPLGSERRPRKTTQWRILQWGLSWGRSRPSRRWIT